MKPTVLAGLRRLRFLYLDNIESGGFSVDFNAPFGSADALQDLAAISGSNDRNTLGYLYFEIMAALPGFAQSASLAPGSYLLPESDEEFEFTAEHARLIPAIRWAAIDASDLVRELTPGPDPSVPGGGWQVRCIHFKRPFGDRTYFQLDMAELLGHPVSEASIPEELEEHLNEVYEQLHLALQVFVEHAEL